VVDALDLKEGDEIEIHVADEREFGVSRKPGREELLNACALFVRIFRPTSSLTETRRMPGSFFDTDVLLSVASGIPPKRTRPKG
jgi:hypothetical protein